VRIGRWRSRCKAYPGLDLYGQRHSTCDAGRSYLAPRAGLYWPQMNADERRMEGGSVHLNGVRWGILRSFAKTMRRICGAGPKFRMSPISMTVHRR
jgi:hypothetical protein